MIFNDKYGAEAPHLSSRYTGNRGRGEAGMTKAQIAIMHIHGYQP